jgi:hypothetical protein
MNALDALVSQADKLMYQPGPSRLLSNGHWLLVLDALPAVALPPGGRDAAAWWVAGEKGWEASPNKVPDMARVLKDVEGRAGEVPLAPAGWVASRVLAERVADLYGMIALRWRDAGKHAAICVDLFLAGEGGTPRLGIDARYYAALWALEGGVAFFGVGDSDPIRVAVDGKTAALVMPRKLP